MKIKNTPFVSIITVNYRQEEATCELLKSIRSNSYKNMEVIVVDNGSIKDCNSLFGKAYPGVTVIQETKNLGFAGGNNLGMHYANGEFLFFVNNDTEFTNGLIENLLARFDTPQVGVVSPKIKYHAQMDTIQYAGFTPINPFTGRNRLIGQGQKDKGQFDTPTIVPYAHGAAMMIRQSVVEKVGMMPESYFLYYEELDWSEQIRKANFLIYYEPKATIYHKESLAVGKSSPMKVFYQTRNRIWYIKKNTSITSTIVFFLYFFLVTIPLHTTSKLINFRFDLLNAFYKGIWQGIRLHAAPHNKVF